MSRQFDRSRSPVNGGRPITRSQALRAMSPPTDLTSDDELPQPDRIREIVRNDPYLVPQRRINALARRITPTPVAPARAAPRWQARGLGGNVRRAKSRFMCITYNLPEDATPDDAQEKLTDIIDRVDLEDRVHYICGQPEMGDRTHRVHLQMYVELKVRANPSMV